MTEQILTIRPEEHKDYKDIVSLIQRSFREGTDYSDGTDIIALVEEIRDSKYHIPELSFVAELDNKIVGHFMFSHFPLSTAKEGGHDDSPTSEIVMLAPVSVHADHFHQGIGSSMIKMGIEKVRERGYKGLPWKEISTFTTGSGSEHHQSSAFSRQAAGRCRSRDS